MNHSIPRNGRWRGRHRALSSALLIFSCVLCLPPMFHSSWHVVAQTSTMNGSEGSESVAGEQLALAIYAEVDEGVHYLVVKVELDGIPVEGIGVEFFQVFEDGRIQSLGRDVTFDDGTAAYEGFDDSIPDAEGYVTVLVRVLAPKKYVGIEKQSRIKHPNPITSVGAIGLDAGEGLYKQHCASCHTIGGGESVGPDLAGLKARIPGKDWAIAFIKSPREMIKSDDYARDLRDKYPMEMAPFESLGDSNISLIVDYIFANDAGQSPESKGFSIPLPFMMFLFTLAMVFIVVLVVWFGTKANRNSAV